MDFYILYKPEGWEVKVVDRSTLLQREKEPLVVPPLCVVEPRSTICEPEPSLPKVGAGEAALAEAR